MLRTGAPRAVLRPLANLSAAPTRTHARCASSSLAQAALRKNALLADTSRPIALSTLRKDMSLVSRSKMTASGAVYGTTRDPEREKALQQRPLNAHPERVSLTSTMSPIFGESKQQDDGHGEVDMMHGFYHDIQMIKETFALQEVPRESFRLGLAGVLPYLATSTATLVSAFEYNAAMHGQSWLLDGRTAELFLHILEPVQVGYGAVILSFLGAIHWGLEWAKFGGSAGWQRYAIGVAAPAIAWPTLLLPVEGALIAQFLAFNVFYAIDARMCKSGFTPPWYHSYRFVLTFVVGASIVLTLIGRGQVLDTIGTMPNATERVKEHAAETKSKKKKSKKAEDDE